MGEGVGEGLQDPLALCGQGSGRRKLGGDEGGTRAAPDRSRGILQHPATSCLRRKGLRCPEPRKWLLCAAERVTAWDPQAWDPSLQGPEPPSPSASATFRSQSFSSQKGQGGDPLSLPPPAPPFPPSFSSLAALCPGAEQLPFQ